MIAAVIFTIKTQTCASVFGCRVCCVVFIKVVLYFYLNKGQNTCSSPGQHCLLNTVKTGTQNEILLRDVVPEGSPAERYINILTVKALMVIKTRRPTRLSCTCVEAHARARVLTKQG